MKLYIKAIWEEDGAYFRSESNVPGLHIEADTLTEFEEVMNDVLPDLLAASPHSNNNNKKSIPLTFTGSKQKEISIALA